MLASPMFAVTEQINCVEKLNTLMTIIDLCDKYLKNKRIRTLSLMNICFNII